MYVDSAYIAKFYVNEPDAPAVRRSIQRAEYVCSSSWALVEVACVFHRHVREGSLTTTQGREMLDVFRGHIERDLWHLIPLSEALLRKTVMLTQTLPREVPLRAGDAVHLVTAVEAGESEIWTNDRHLLAAASHFGILGRSV